MQFWYRNYPHWIEWSKLALIEIFYLVFGSKIYCWQWGGAIKDWVRLKLISCVVRCSMSVVDCIDSTYIQTKSGLTVPDNSVSFEFKTEDIWLESDRSDATHLTSHLWGFNTEPICISLALLKSLMKEQIQRTSQNMNWTWWAIVSWNL